MEEDRSEVGLADDVRRLHHDSLLESATVAVAFGSLFLLAATLMDAGLAAVLLAALSVFKTVHSPNAANHLRYALTWFASGAFSGAGAMAAHYFSRSFFKRSLFLMTQNDIHPYVHHNPRSARASYAGFGFQLAAIFCTLAVCGFGALGFIEILKVIA